MRQRFSGVWRFGKDLVARVGEADLSGLSAEMAYRFLFALFPFVLFLVALAGFLGTEEMALAVTEWMQEAMPEQAAAIMAGPVEEVMLAQRGDLLSLGAIAALWGASAVMATVMKGMNRTHRVADDRGFLVKNALKVGLTLFLTVMMLLALVAVIGTHVVVAAFGGFGLGPVQSILAAVAGPLAALAVMVFAVSVVYWRAPAGTGHPFRLVNAGASLFAIGWIAGTVLLSWYIAAFGNYNEVYGSIGGVIVLLVWAYWSSFLLLLGAAFNAVLEERRGAGAWPVEAGREPGVEAEERRAA